MSWFRGLSFHHFINEAVVNIFGCPLHPGDEVLAAVPFPVVELRDAVGVGRGGLFDYFSVHCYFNLCPETKIAGRVILISPQTLK